MAERAEDRAVKVCKGRSMATGYVRGAQAAKAGMTLDGNPYKNSRRGFGAAYRRVWELGFLEFERGLVTV